MKTNTIRIALIGISDGDTAQLTSNLHRIGYASRMASCREPQQFIQLLNNDGCDLVLLDVTKAVVEPGQCAELIAKSGRDVPLILYSEQLSLKLGDQYNDIIASGDMDRLTHSCGREFLALSNRRELALLHERLQHAEQRSEMLLSQADAAIAYIADGMIISANDKFASQFGFSSAEDLECLPLIDLITGSDQDRIKNALKSQPQSDSSNRLGLRCIGADGKEFETQLNLQNAVYDGEDCIQISLGEAAEAGAPTASAIDSTTQFANAEMFMEKLADVTRHGLSGGQEGVFLLAAVDRYHERRGVLGLSNCQKLIADTASLLREEFPDAEFGRVGDDLLACITQGINVDNALTRAKGICKKAEARIVEIEGRSEHYTLSLGIAPLTQGPQSVEPDILLDQVYNVCEQLREDAANGGIGNGAALHVRQRQRLHRDLNAVQIFEEARIDERLRLIFQPLVCLGDESGDHYEVTLDLADQQDDEIGGPELLSLAEKQELGTELDRWLIVEATKQLSDIHPQHPHTRLIINLSCNVFRDKELLPWLGVALKASRLPAEALVLQFNLSVVANFLGPAATFAKELKKLGCQFAAHGLGSSVEQKRVLDKVPVDLMKIDNALTGEHKLQNDELKQAINLLHEHQGRAIIPNVDSAATLATLWQLGPDFIQGDYVHGASLEMDYDFAEAG